MTTSIFKPMLLSTPNLKLRQLPSYEARLRDWLTHEGTKRVIAVSYVAQLEAMRAIGLLEPREKTRILLRPVDGFARTDAEKLQALCSKVPGLDVRQLKPGASYFVPHLKVLHFDTKEFGKLAVVGSSNLTNRGIRENLEVNALVDAKFEGFGALSATLEQLWNELSEPLRPNDFTEFIFEKGNISAGAHLLEFQRDALLDLEGYYARVRGDGGAMLSLPTGAGKTVIAARFLLEAVLRKPNARVLWIAPQRELVTQAAATFASQRGFYHIPQLRIEPMSVVQEATHSRSLDSEYNVIFRVMHTAAKQARGQAFDAMVVDEAHWGASEGRAMLPHLLEDLRVRFRLGLTATPFRTVASERTLMEDHFPYRVLPPDGLEDVVDAAGRRVLARPTQQREPTGVTIRFDPAKIAAYEDDRQALEVIKDAERNKLVARTWRRETHKTTLVFAYDIEHANMLGRAFVEQHPTARVQVLHTGELLHDLRMTVRPVEETFTAEDRQEIYRLFRRGDIDVLIAVNLYVAGVDFPGVHSLFMARPTLSPVLYAQMLGRGRRGPAFGGTDEVKVVDFADQFETHAQLGNRLMSLSAEREFGEVQVKRERRWKRIQVELGRRELVSQALGRRGDPVLYRVVTDGGFLRKRLSRSSDLAATLDRLLTAGGSVRRDHWVESWRVEPGWDPLELEVLVREYSPDSGYRDDGGAVRGATAVRSAGATATKKPALQAKKKRRTRALSTAVNAFGDEFIMATPSATKRRRKKRKT